MVTGAVRDADFHTPPTIECLVGPWWWLTPPKPVPRRAVLNRPGGDPGTPRVADHPRILEAAHQTARQILAEAEQARDRIRTSSGALSDSIRDDAHREAREIVEEARREVALAAQARRAAYDDREALRRAATRLGLAPEPTPEVLPEPPARPTPVLPALAVAVVGVCLQTVGYVLGWTGTTAPGLPLWAVGLVLLVAPFGWLATRDGLSDRTLAGLGLAFALLMYASWLLTNPLMATRFDESLHVTTLLDLTEREGLFQRHDMLPVSPFYPGLELATSALHWLTGLPDMACQVAVVGLSRTVLVVALFAGVRRVTRSGRAGFVAVLLYGASPQFYFFNAQFSYQTVAIAMLAAALWLLARAYDAPQRWPWREILPALACLGALAVTHHLTSWLTLATLLVVAVLFALGREWRRARLTSAVAGLSVLAIVAWSALVGPTLITYLGPIFEAAGADIVAIFSGDGPERSPGSGNGGEATPPWDLAVMALSILVWLALLAPSCWAAWRQRSIGRSVARYLPLVMAASYPLLHLTRFSSKAGEIGDRVSTFLFLAMALVVAAWLAPRLRPRRTVAATAVLGLVVLVLGGTIFGSGPAWQRTTGPYKPAAEQRAVDGTTVAVARWFERYVPVGARVGADNTFNRVLPNYADVRMVTSPGGLDGMTPVFIAEELEAYELGILVDTGTDFLVVDTRQADRQPFGSLFEGSSGYGEAGARISSEQLAKFADQPGFELVVDGPVKVYDVRGLRDEPRVFDDRSAAPLPGRFSWWRSVLTLLVLAGAVVTCVRLRVRSPADVRLLLLALPALMLLGLATVVLGLPGWSGAVVLPVAAAAVLWRAPRTDERSPGRRPGRRTALGAVALAAVLATATSAAGWATAQALLDTPVPPAPGGTP